MATAAKKTSPENKLLAAFRENMTPESIAMLISMIQPVGNYRNGDKANEDAINQVQWLSDKLLEMIGVHNFNDMASEIGI